MHTFAVGWVGAGVYVNVVTKRHVWCVSVAASAGVASIRSATSAGHEGGTLLL